MQGIGNLIDFQAFLSKLKSLFVEKEAGKGLSSNDYTDSEKSKLSGIANNANNYSLPTASASTLGGIKIGEGLSIDNGILNASSSNGLKVIGYGTNITNGTITFNEAVSIVMGTRITTSIYGSELNGTPNTFIIFPGQSYGYGNYQAGETVSLSADGRNFNISFFGEEAYYEVYFDYIGLKF